MDTFNQSLFSAMEMAVLEENADGKFTAVGTLPQWFSDLYPEFSDSETINLEHRLRFLAHFFSDARDLWKNGGPGRLKSGQWTEKDRNGQLFQLEATAVAPGKRKVLVLETGNYSKQEKKFLIQNHSALSFDAKMLEAFEYQEAQIRAHAREQLETELQTLRDENEDLKIRLAVLEKNN